MQNQQNEALLFAQQALALHREVGDRSSECAALNVLGIIRAHLDEYEGAEGCLRQSLNIAESIGYSQGISIAASNLVGMHYERRGDFEGCLQFVDTWLDKAKDAGDDWLVASLRHYRGRAYLHLGQYDRACRSLATSSQVMEKLGDISLGLPARVWSGLGQAYLGDFEGAVWTLLNVADRAREARLDFELAKTLVTIGFVTLLAGQAEKLRGGLERVLDGLELLPDADILHSWGSFGCETAAGLYLALGEADEALQCSTRGLQLMESNPSPWWPERRYFTHSRILRALGQEAEADMHLKRAYDRVMLVAGNTKDQELRRSWLENVQVNREILEMCIQRGISQ